MKICKYNQKQLNDVIELLKQEQKDPIIGYDVERKPLFASVAKKKFKEQLCQQQIKY